MIRNGAIAQLVARYIRIVEARGSNPLSSTTICLKTTVFRLFLFIRGVPKEKRRAFFALHTAANLCFLRQTASLARFERLQRSRKWCAIRFGAQSLRPLHSALGSILKSPTPLFFRFLLKISNKLLAHMFLQIIRSSHWCFQADNACLLTQSFAIISIHFF